MFFVDWINFLQIIVEKNLYLKLFENFNFNKGVLAGNDRLLYEPAFVRSVKAFDENMSVQFLIYLGDIMKNSSAMVSFGIFKKKIVTNLKNYIDA
jgi:hypothetical protein